MGRDNVIKKWFHVEWFPDEYGVMLGNFKSECFVLWEIGSVRTCIGKTISGSQPKIKWLIQNMITDILTETGNSHDRMLFMKYGNWEGIMW